MFGSFNTDAANKKTNEKLLTCMEEQQRWKEEFKDDPDWHEFMKQEITAWRDFHQFWIN